MWRPGRVVNNLLEDITHYLAATPNFWAPLLTTIDQSTKPPPILKPTNPQKPTNNSATTITKSKTVHWKDQMREKRMICKQSKKLVRRKQRSNFEALILHYLHQNAMHQVRHMGSKPCKRVPIDTLEIPKLPNEEINNITSSSPSTILKHCNKPTTKPPKTLETPRPRVQIPPTTALSPLQRF